MKRVGISFGRQKNSMYGIHSGYASAVTHLGAIPFLFSSASTEAFERPDTELSLTDYAKEVVSSVDALILSGGSDVNPAQYGEEPSQNLHETDPVRDRFELALIHEALTQDKKIFAICRGMQILNVALGGTLYQDLESSGFDNHSDLKNEYGISHNVSLDESSILGGITGSQLGVNSIHHQALKSIAPGLRAIAFSHDNVVEAVESSNCLGVQWHPERLFTTDPRHLAGFSWLLEP